MWGGLHPRGCHSEFFGAFAVARIQSPGLRFFYCFIIRNVIIRMIVLKTCTSSSISQNTSISITFRISTHISISLSICISKSISKVLPVVY